MTKSPPSPPPLSFGEFFPDNVNFDLFGNSIALPEGRGGRSQRADRPETLRLRETIRQLAAAGLTRVEIAKHAGVGESTLYQNFFAEIGVRSGCPGRRAHAPSLAQRRLVKLRAAAGATPSEIAAELGLSPPTVRKHYRNELYFTSGELREDANDGA